ncbi:MAG: response regulator [Desulfobacteraceae bacterium]|jgi:DNA-binding NtrC family response regulator
MEETDKNNSGTIKLLFVDDEKGFVHVLSNRLSKRGIDVCRTYSGSEGIRALREQDFDVALLDLKMEDMDGLEVLKIFKKMYPQMAVIMLTGHGSEQAAREGIEYGAFDYLTKPCELDELLEKIHDAMESKGGKDHE